MNQKQVDISRDIQLKEEEMQEFTRIKKGFEEVLSDYFQTVRQAQEELLENYDSVNTEVSFEEMQESENEQLLFQDVSRKVGIITSDLEEESIKYKQVLQEAIDDLEALYAKEK